jgi:hypothetical protein
MHRGTALIRKEKDQTLLLYEDVSWVGKGRGTSAAETMPCERVDGVPDAFGLG